LITKYACWYSSYECFKLYATTVTNNTVTVSIFLQQLSNRYTLGEETCDTSNADPAVCRSPCIESTFYVNLVVLGYVLKATTKKGRQLFQRRKVHPLSENHGYPTPMTTYTRRSSPMEWQYLLVVSWPLQQRCNGVLAGKPTWTERPRSVNATVGETVSFGCRASSNPPPNLRWYINNNDVTDSPSTGALIIGMPHQGRIVYFVWVFFSRPFSPFRSFRFTPFFLREVAHQIQLIPAGGTTWQPPDTFPGL